MLRIIRGSRWSCTGAYAIVTRASRNEQHILRLVEMRAARWVLLVLAITMTNTANGRLLSSPAGLESVRSFHVAGGMPANGMGFRSAKQVRDGPRARATPSHLLGALPY